MLNLEHSASLTESAYHEAGHAVVACILGIAVERVTIEEDQRLGFTGRTFRKILKTDASPRVIVRRRRNDLAVHVAGPIAELRFNPNANREAFSHDYTEAERLAFGNKQFEIQDAERRADDLLCRHWPLVEHVAAALIDHRTLNKHELWAAIRQARRATIMAKQPRT
jgi:ATP-dependent Zn protease